MRDTLLGFPGVFGYQSPDAVQGVEREMRIELGAKYLGFGFAHGRFQHDFFQLGEPRLLYIMVHRVGEYPSHHVFAPARDVSPKHKRLVGQIVGDDFTVDRDVDERHDYPQHQYRHAHPEGQPG